MRNRKPTKVEAEKAWPLYRELRGLLDDKRLREFDDRIESAVLPKQWKDELFELKAQSIEAEQRKREQARYEQLKTLIDQRKWAEFDAQWPTEMGVSVQ